MSEMIPDGADKLEIAYENDAAASFLAIKGHGEMLEYQVLMLGHNRIRHVVPVDVIRKENVTCFYYNITSRISLAFHLKRQKFNREAFLKMLLNIASAVDEAGGYLLTDSNFIFDPEYIYINPETLEPDLIYIPAVMDDGGGARLAAFVSDLVLLHINVSRFDSGNFVQRILASVKSEIFNIKEFIILLNELLYGQEPRDRDTAEQGNETGDMHGARDIRGIQNSRSFGTRRNMQNAGEARGIPGVKEDRKKKDFAAPVWNKKEEKKVSNDRTMKKVNEKVSKTKWLPALAVLAQFIMGVVIYRCRGFLAGLGDDPAATYVAVAMIVLAVEVFLFKKLKDAGKDSFDKAGELRDFNGQRDDIKKTPVPGAEPISEGLADRDRPGALGGAHLYPDGRAYEEASASAASSRDISGPTACKTELLGCYAKGARVLKSTGSPGGDEDIYIDKDDFIIGRLSGYVDHVLANNAVGKLHAQMTRRNGVCYVRDLNSVNGTFINNRRIESNKDVELKNNDKLQLANSEFVFIND